MTLTQLQFDALKVAFENGILDHDALAKEALALVLENVQTK